MSGTAGAIRSACETPANRVEATTEISNVAEQCALEKAGFTREGVLRGSIFRQGRYRDAVIYSVLRAEVTVEDSASGDGSAAGWS
jgi:RimJ/RimL family protein N-acetyltransferase